MLMVKTQVKGFFWYNKKVFTGTAPKTFEELLAIEPRTVRSPEALLRRF